MIQTLEKTYFIGYEHENFDRANQHLANLGKKYFQQLSGVEFSEPLVVYTPDPAAEGIAHKVSKAFENAVTIPSPHILGDIDVEPHRSGPLSIDLLIDGSTHGLEPYTDPLLIVVTRERFVRRFTGTHFDWLFAQVDPLEPVVPYRNVLGDRFTDDPFASSQLVTCTMDSVKPIGDAYVQSAYYSSVGDSLSEPQLHDSFTPKELASYDSIFANA